MKSMLQCGFQIPHTVAAFIQQSHPSASALTDALIAGIANGSKAYRLVGSFVSTPLNWSLSVLTNPTH